MSVICLKRHTNFTLKWKDQKTKKDRDKETGIYPVSFVEEK